MVTKKAKEGRAEMQPSLEGVLEFLKILSAHNDRDWFAAHKERYLEIKAKVETFIAWLLPRMLEFDKDMAMVDHRKCMYRIYRDTRFSPDKRPYKDYIGIGISRLGRHGLCSGYYIHFQPGATIYGAGVYGLPPDKLKKVRDGIYFQSAAFRHILQSPEMVRVYGGEMWEEARMKMPPKGYDKDFPDIDLLKYRHYFVEHQVPDSRVSQADFAGEVLDGLRIVYPFNKFLNEALDF